MKTSATSRASRRGISESSTEGGRSAAGSAVEEEVVEDEVLEGRRGAEVDRNATQGLTPSSVFARLSGSWHKCSTANGGGRPPDAAGRPISS